MNFPVAKQEFQEAWAGYGKRAELVRLPPSYDEVMPGVVWGSPEHFNTPAYWAVRSRWEDENPDYVTGNNDLFREVAFCLLGGFGIRYEVNQAAFARLEAHGFFDRSAHGASESVIRKWLREPLIIGDRLVRYRFPNQRARRLARMACFFEVNDLSALEGEALRDTLMAIEGVGPKTASWIVRNCHGSDDVAIIDVHLVRACTTMGVFPERISLPRDYAMLEERFLAFARALDIRPSVLDAVIWSEVRKTRVH